MKNDSVRNILGLIFLCTAFLLIMYGILNKEVLTVFNKAINICMECIGIG